MELDVLERLARPRERRFPLRRAVRIVECRPQGPAPGERPKVFDRQGGRKPPLGDARSGNIERQKWPELVQPRSPSSDHSLCHVRL